MDMHSEAGLVCGLGRMAQQQWRAGGVMYIKALAGALLHTTDHPPPHTHTQETTVLPGTSPCTAVPSLITQGPDVGLSSELPNVGHHCDP